MSSVQRLPLVPAPPHDPTFLVLTGSIGAEPRSGFQTAALAGVRIVTAGDCARLVLAPGIGGARRWPEPSGSFGGLRLPGNVAVSETGDIYLLDRTQEVLKRFDPCDCEFKIVNCRGSALVRPMRAAPTEECVPTPSQARRSDDWFHGATSIATCHGDLFVTNPLWNGVLRFALNGLVLRERMAPPSGRKGSLPAGQRWRPTCVAIDGRGYLWVADAENARMDRFAPRGNWVEGWSGLPSIKHLAVDCTDRVYAIIDGDASAAQEFVEGTLRPVLGDPPDFQEKFPALAFPVDSLGHLHLASFCSS